jgi:hypothetical protein
MRKAGVRFYANGKIWIFADCSEKFLPRVTKCLNKPYLFSTRFNGSAFKKELTRAGVSRSERSRILRCLRIDDDVYFVQKD